MAVRGSELTTRRLEEAGDQPRVRDQYGLRDDF